MRLASSIIGISVERLDASGQPPGGPQRSEAVVTMGARWRVIDNESGDEAIVGTPVEAVEFINSRFDTNEDDEVFSITEVGPLLPKPLGAILAWAVTKDDERTDGRAAPITIRPIVTDGRVDECDLVELWGDGHVSWDYDRYIVAGTDDFEYGEAYSTAELCEILDMYADYYNYPESEDSDLSGQDREPIELGTQQCASRFSHLDDDALLWLAATQIVLDMWRNTPIEDWHAGTSPLSDGDMMRINAATTRLVRSLISFDHVDWVAVGLAIVNPSRVLPTGQSVLELGLDCHNPDDPAHEDDPRDNLAEMALDAILWGRICRLREREFGLRAVIEAFCSYDNGWFGAPSWGRIVDRFIAAVDDRESPHWHIHREMDWFNEWFTTRPADIADTQELRRLLLAGPDQLSRAAAEWCVDGAIGFICREDHANGCWRCDEPTTTSSG